MIADATIPVTSVPMNPLMACAIGVALAALA